MTWAESLAPLRLVPFRRLVIGRTISMLGNGIAPIALAFAVLDLTHSPRDLGFVVAARSVTNVIFILIGGVIADRLPRQLVMVASASLAGLFQLVAAVLMFSHTATVPLLMLCAAFGGIAQSFTFPAVSALLGQVIPAELRQSGNALNRLGANAAMIVGSTAGGFLVAIFNPGLGLAIDAATFFAAAFFFSLVRAPRVAGKQASGDRVPSVLHELRVGWREFKARTWLWVVVLGFMFLNAAMAGAFGVLGPAVADETIGRTAFGIALGAETLGMVLGGLFALRFRFRRLLLAGVVAMALPALPLAVLAAGASPAALIGTCLIAGLGIELFGVAWETSMQEHVPADLLARVYSYDMLGSIVAIPLGQVAAGPAGVAFGNSVAVFGAVAVILLAVVGMVSSRSVRELQHSVSSAAEVPEPVPA